MGRGQPFFGSGIALVGRLRGSEFVEIEDLLETNSLSCVGNIFLGKLQHQSFSQDDQAN